MTGRLSGTASISGGVAPTASMGGTMTIPTVVAPPIYDGPYEVTPGASAVTLETNGMAMAGDIVINPIPSNYGLITWNGSTITVS